MLLLGTFCVEKKNPANLKELPTFEMADNEMSKEGEHVDMHDDDANDEVCICLS
jgi:hypothetical protein